MILLLGAVAGNGARRKGKQYISRNVVPLMEKSLLALDGELSEAELLDQLADDGAGYSVAGRAGRGPRPHGGSTHHPHAF